MNPFISKAQTKGLISMKANITPPTQDMSLLSSLTRKRSQALRPKELQEVAIRNGAVKKPDIRYIESSTTSYSDIFKMQKDMQKAAGRIMEERATEWKKRGPVTIQAYQVAPNETIARAQTWAGKNGAALAGFFTGKWFSSKPHENGLTTTTHMSNGMTAKTKITRVEHKKTGERGFLADTEISPTPNRVLRTTPEGQAKIMMRKEIKRMNKNTRKLRKEIRAIKIP